MAGSQRLVHASLVAVAAMWGLVFVGVHQLLPVMGAAELVTVRFVIISVAFLALLACVPSLRVFPADRADWARFALCGLCAVPGSQLLIVEGQRYLSPQLASLVVTVSPVVTALLAAVMLDERLTPVRIAGSVVALAGVTFIVLFGAGGGLQHPRFEAPAILAVGTPICWSLYTVLSRPLSHRYPPVATVGLSLSMGTVVLLPFTVGTAHVLTGLSAGDWGWVVYLALGGSFVPYLIWYRSLKTLPANSVAVYMYAVPVAAAIFTWLILHRSPGPVTWVGAACVLVGVVLSQAPGWRRIAAADAATLVVPAAPVAAPAPGATDEGGRTAGTT